MARTRTPKFAPPQINIVETPEIQLRYAKAAAARAVSIFSPIIKALTPVFLDEEKTKATGMNTMGVDKYCRIYVSIPFVEQMIKLAEEVSPNNPCKICERDRHHRLAYVGGVVVHEAYHVVRRHYKRFEAAKFTNPMKYNVAADFEINDDIVKIFEHLQNEQVPQLCLPPFVLLPQTSLQEDGTPFPKDRTAEEYYMMLPTIPCPVHGDPDNPQDQQNQQGSGQQGQDGQGEEENQNQQGQGSGQEQGDSQDQQGQGSGGQNQDDSQRQSNQNHQHGGGKKQCTCIHGDDHGSGVAGETRPWEQGSPSSDKPGLSEVEQKIFRKEVAKKIKEASNKQRGYVPAELERWADELLEGKYDWRRELSKHVIHELSKRRGTTTRAYKRLGILTGSFNNKVIFPAKFDPEPTVDIVVDTSGSMSTNDLTLALSEVKSILQQLRAKVRFCSVDASASEVTEVKNVNDIKLMGGGGTDMRVGINKMLENKPTPSTIIVMTDGETPWPNAPLNGGRVNLICCIVGDHSADLDSVPSWAVGVKITNDKAEKK